MLLILIFLIGFLLLANAFFVAAEFSLVAVRPTRIEELIQAGVRRGGTVKELIENLDRVLSGVQLGITLASLALGWVSENLFARLLAPLFADLSPRHVAAATHSVALAFAFLLITFLHVVLGELVPKSLALQRSEKVAMVVAQPMNLFLKTFRFFIDFLDGCNRAMVRWLGYREPAKHSLVHSAEELRMIVSASQERGVLKETQEEMIHAVFDLTQANVREVMVPRPDILALDLALSFDAVVQKLLEYKHSRLPVYEGSIDHIRGVLYARDLLRALHERQKRMLEAKSVPDVDWRKLVRPAFIVPETKSLHELLHEFLERRLQLALAVDEFGSISGLITLEDVLERIVGEIRDEYEEVEMPLLLSDGAMVFDASLNIRELETSYEIHFPRERGFETIAGFVVTQLGFIPTGGESFVYDGLRFTVVEMDRRRVARVKIERAR